VRARILIALAVVGALAGCQESGFDESKETQRPLKVQDAMNPLTGTKVPGQAERPATLTPDTLGDTLALHLTPVVAVVGNPRVPPYLRRATRGIEIIRSSNLAAVEAAAPDVILGTKELDAEKYPDLMTIAPTILSEGSDWKLNLRLHGEGLGRTNDAEKLLIDWDNRVARVRRMIGNEKLQLRLSGAGQVSDVSLDSDTPAGSTLADLGIKPYKPLAHRGYRVIDVTVGQEWVDAGVLAARARLEDIANAL
jgi:ABC-type Fe3+-hydroxamate transport system substrate-binding protein